MKRQIRQRLTALLCCISAILVNAGLEVPGADAATATAIIQDDEYKAFTLPIEAAPDGHGGPILEVRLNKSISARFLLDTGAGFSLISEEMVKKLGIKAERVHLASGKPDVKGNDVEAARIPSVGFGRSDFGVPFVVASDRYSPSKGAAFLLRELGVDGILGTNVLSICPFMIDFRKRRLTFFRDSDPSDQLLRKTGLDPAVAVKLTLKNYAGSTSLYSVEVGYTDNDSVPLLIDTGCKRTILPQRVQKPLEGQDIRLMEERTMQFPSGPVRTRLVILKSLRFGNLRSDPLTALIAQEKSFYDAVLGMDVLRQYVVFLDLKQKQMYLQP